MDFDVEAAAGTSVETAANRERGNVSVGQVMVDGSSFDHCLGEEKRTWSCGRSWSSFGQQDGEEFGGLVTSVGLFWWLGSLGKRDACREREIQWRETACFGD